MELVQRRQKAFIVVRVWDAVHCSTCALEDSSIVDTQSRQQLLEASNSRVSGIVVKGGRASEVLAVDIEALAEKGIAGAGSQSLIVTTILDIATSHEKEKYGKCRNVSSDPVDALGHSRTTLACFEFLK